MADFMLMFDRKQQNSIKQLSFNLKINKFIKKRKRLPFYAGNVGPTRILAGELRSHVVGQLSLRVATAEKPTCCLEGPGMLEPGPSAAEAAMVSTGSGGDGRCEGRQRSWTATRSDGDAVSMMTGEALSVEMPLVQRLW